MRRLPPPRRGLRLLTGKVGIVVIAVLVLAAMAGTAALVLDGRSDDDGGARRSSSASDAPARKRPAASAGTFFRARSLGVEGIRPPGWRIARSARAVRLNSPGRAGIVAVSTAPRSVSAKALMTSTLTALRRSYGKARLSKRRGVALGGRAGIAVSGSATNSRGVRLDLLVSTARGSRRTYLLQVFVAHSAAGLRLGQAQALVESLEFSG